MQIETIIKILAPITLIEVKNYLVEHLTEICSKKDSNFKIISKQKNDILFCEFCGYLLHKNRKIKSVIQKYIF